MAQSQWTPDDRLDLAGIGLIPGELDIKTIISVNARNDLREVKIHTHGRGLLERDAAETDIDDEPHPPQDQYDAHHDN